MDKKHIYAQTSKHSAKPLSFESIKELYDSNIYNNIVWLSIKNHDIHASLVMPKNLTTLILNKVSGCKYICDVPESIFNINIRNSDLVDATPLLSPKHTNLESLYLVYNHLGKVPENIPDNVVICDFSSNFISKLPETNCFTGSRLHTVDLSMNHLTELPKWILDVPPQVTIRMDTNRFWFLIYSDISPNREPITSFHYEMANRYFSSTGLHSRFQRVERLQNINDEPRQNYLPNYVNQPYVNDTMNRNTNINKTNKTTAEQGQNVHNRSIQDSFSTSVQTIVALHDKLPAKSKTNPDDIVYSMRSYYIWRSWNIAGTLMFLGYVVTQCNLVDVVSAAGITYRALLHKMWDITRDHEHKKVMRQIIKQEIMDGMGFCFTGRITRLVNAFSGFVDGVQIRISTNEQISDAMIAVMRRCEKDSKLVPRDEAKKALDDLNIGPADQTTWLMAFDE